jgi:hypothetical protein
MTPTLRCWIAVLALLPTAALAEDKAPELIRYRTADGQIGFAQDSHSVPPGAQILPRSEPQPSGPGSVQIIQPPAPSTRRAQAKPESAAPRPRRSPLAASASDDDSEQHDPSTYSPMEDTPDAHADEDQLLEQIERQEKAVEDAHDATSVCKKRYSDERTDRAEACREAREKRREAQEALDESKRRLEEEYPQ